MKLSLRARLLTVLAVLLVLGLAASDVATYTVLRRQLLRGLDQELAAARRPFERALSGTRGTAPAGSPTTLPATPAGSATTGSATTLPATPAGSATSGSATVGSAPPARSATPAGAAGGARPPGPDGLSPLFSDAPRVRGLLASGTYLGVRDSKGSVLVEFTADSPPPRVPASALRAAQAAPGSVRSLTLSVPGEEVPDRALIVALPRGTLVLGKSLESLNDTVHKLAVVELIVTVAALLSVGLLALWLVRVGMHPLTDIELTAEAIARGDLTKRVPHASEGTEVGRLATALNAMLAQIEAAFAERTASERQLRRFAADASHELRTPLTSIRGYAELFRRGAAREPEQLEQAMRRIEEEAARMGVLVEDLLLLARLDQGRPLERRPVDLAAMARDAVADARAVEPDRPIHVEADGPVTVLGDPARLYQVAANLLANVRAHTPPATPVTVAVRATDGRAVLEVRDQGPGLNADQTERVFERFYRTDSARTRGRGGTGLGLSIVAAIAHAHAGRASVRSEPGQGAVFRVELPVGGPPAPSHGDEVINLGDDGEARDGVS